MRLTTVPQRDLTVLLGSRHSTSGGSRCGWYADGAVYRSSAVTLGITVLAGSSVFGEHPDPVLHQRDGASTGVTGSPVISFKSLTDSTFNSPSFFSLGDFQVAGAPGRPVHDLRRHPVPHHADRGQGRRRRPRRRMRRRSSSTARSTARSPGAISRPSGRSSIPSAMCTFQTGDFQNILTIPIARPVPRPVHDEQRRDHGRGPPADRCLDGPRADLDRPVPDHPRRPWPSPPLRANRIA